jgi:hypothetical protein
MASIDWNCRNAWHKRTDELPVLLQLQFETAFQRLARGKTAPTNAAERHAASLQPAATISYDSLPTMLSIMNMAVTLDDLSDVARAFAARTTDGELPPSMYDLRFEWRGVTALYDHLVPDQNALIGKFLKFFNMLDADNVDTIRVADLRHALCRLGAVPLTDAEFNHMLYRHRMLHRANVTVFEFVRLLLDTPMPPVEAALVDLHDRMTASRVH